MHLRVGCGIQILTSGVAFKFSMTLNHTIILLDEDFTSEVSDFGLSKLSSMDEITVYCNLAPELLYQDLGLTLYRLLKLRCCLSVDKTTRSCLWELCLRAATSSAPFSLSLKKMAKFLGQSFRL